MAQFNYTLPSGAKFTLNAPNGTTQAEADKTFYSQVAAGAFVGYRVGDTLTNPQSALTNFGLSRIERGTAAVDDGTLLAVINGLPVVAPLPPLVNTPIQNPINQADYVNITSGLGPAAIGSLSAKEVNALMAQTAAIVGQDADQITQDKGVGKYGFNCEALERAGYIKPGTAERYMNGQSVGTEPNPDNFVDILSSPSVWTGKDGVVSVDAILVDDNAQNKIQAELMENSYYSMVTAGLIAPPIQNSTAPVSTGQTWGIGQTLMATSALTLVATAFGYNGTNKLFGDFKNIISGNTLSDSLSSFGGSVSSLASGAYNTLGNLDIKSAGALATTVATSVNADVGALVANASKYGPQASALWAKTGNLSLDGIAAVGTAGFDSAVGSAKALAGNIYAQGTAAAGAAIAGLQGQATAIQAQAKAAMDTLGKASQSAVNFSNYSISGLVSGVQPGAAFNNTVDRSTVDAAVTRVIGSDKITTPSFELPSLASLGISKDIEQAQNYLKTAQEAGQSIVNQGQQALAQGQAAYSQATQLASSVQSQGTGLLNAARSFGGGRGLG